MPRRCARMIERSCCAVATFIPLLFVYGSTSWATWVVVEIGKVAPKGSWLGTCSSIIGIVLYILLNWSYTTAVFTNPGSTTNRQGYGLLPTTQTQGHPPATSFTVKSNGELRFCKKCQARKPDRAHHCSTCRRCVLKMDHHCPWLATCLGLRNYKPFLLFLIYTTLLCLYALAVSGTWVWAEVIEMDTQQLDNLLPVNFIILSIISGIIGLVVGVFTGWHLALASRGQTTIECLEKTRYLSPLKQAYRATHNPANRLPQAAQRFVNLHANALPGVTRPEEGEERRANRDFEARRPHSGSWSGQLTYEEREREQSRRRYEEYLDEQDSTKLPNAFDLGWKKNLLHLFGPNPWLWAIPICNTTGDGWSWEASPKWLQAREGLRREREAQRVREINAGWGGGGGGGGGGDGDDDAAPGPYSHQNGTARQAPSKADRILGRDPSLYVDRPQSMRMQRLNPRGQTVEEELLDSDEEESSEEGSYRNGGGGGSGGNGSSRTSPFPEEESKHEAVATGTRRTFPHVTHGRGWGRGSAMGMLPPKGSGTGTQARDSRIDVHSGSGSNDGWGVD